MSCLCIRECRYRYDVDVDAVIGSIDTRAACASSEVDKQNIDELFVEHLGSLDEVDEWVKRTLLDFFHGGTAVEWRRAMQAQWGEANEIIAAAQEMAGWEEDARRRTDGALLRRR